MDRRNRRPPRGATDDSSSVTDGKSAVTSGEWKSIDGDPSGRDGLLRTILHDLDTGIAVADRSGMLVFFNAAAERILGSGVRNGPSTDWSATYGCFLPDKKTPFPSEQLPLARALRGEHVRDVEMFIRNENVSSGAWISVSGTPLYRKTGELLGGVVSFLDITDRKARNDVVRRLSHAVERTTDCVFITDARGIIEYVNPAFEQTTGYGREEAVGRTPRILKSGLQGSEYYDRLWATLLAGEVFSANVINRKKSGEPFHAEQTITPVKNRGGDITHFVSVARDVTELRKAQEQEVQMRLARMVQQRLYPSRAPKLPGFDLAGAARPADATGGDYFGFLPMLDDCVGIAVGDVSGHGIAPALLMAQTHAYLRSLTRTMTDPGRILHQVNEFLHVDIDEERFVTLMLMRLDPDRRSFSYASAGHEPGFLLDGSGAVKSVLGATGLPLGLFPAGDYPVSREISLASGDLILLLTDGITETHGPGNSQFGEERVLEVVRAQRHREAREIVDSLHSAARAFAAHRPQLDDMAAVVCKTLSD